MKKTCFMLSKILGEKRIKVAELSRLTGITESTLNKYYNDKIQRFDRNILDKIANALNCDVSDLFENDKEIVVTA